MKSRRHRGSAMIEFAVVGPIMTLLGLAVLQYGLLFFAKNQLNYASFMAARAGSMGNADLGMVQKAYVRALVPMYGGGLDENQLAESYAKAAADVAANAQIEVLNPTKESFDDWNDESLNQKYGHRAIANGGQAYKSPTDVRLNSGQSIQDANLIKLRITLGYQPQVPLIRLIYTTYLRWLDPHTDAFHTQLVNAGRVPVVTLAPLHFTASRIAGQTGAEASIQIDGPSDGSVGAPPVTALFNSSSISGAIYGKAGAGIVVVGVNPQGNFRIVARRQ